MKPGAGRNKGNAFEREIAKTVVEAFKDYGIRKRHIYRTPGSGGHRYARDKDPGDLVIHKKLRKLFNFSVECKSYREINLFDLFLPFKKHKKSSKFKQWLKQCCSSAERTRQPPLLVFKKNRSEILCALQVSRIVTGIMYNGNPYQKFRYNHDDWYVVRFNDLLKQLLREQEAKNGNI